MNACSKALSLPEQGDMSSDIRRTAGLMFIERTSSGIDIVALFSEQYARAEIWHRGRSNLDAGHWPPGDSL